ncbi:MAG: N-acetylmuramoyl-L-alanine amidase [Saprospiraceae bacterium]|nr:N-acetylmuramoyl-L-alanine amidase [Saprospiraceae bacterium]
MNPSDKIIAGKKYYLPISIYSFDGKSIRSTLKIKDYDKAKSIEKYNNTLTEAKLTKSNYKDSKILYVPFAYLDQKPIQQPQKVQNLSKNTPSTNKKTKTLIADFKMDSAQVAALFKRSDFAAEEQTDLTSDKEMPLVKKVSGKSVKVDLFGKEKGEVYIESNQLSDQVFYIVPGHGGPDPGAMVKHTSGNVLCEDEYAYDVSLRLARNLIKHGAIVHIIVQDKHNGIRDERYLDCDNTEKVMGNLEMPVNQKKRLRQGMAKVNELYTVHKSDGIKKQWMISIHIDSQPEANRQDVFFYYQSDSRRSKKKAEKLQKVFADKYKIYQGRDYQGTISTRPLYVIKASNPDPIFVELANIRNPKDQERILSPKNRQVLADWMLEGFLQ